MKYLNPLILALSMLIWGQSHADVCSQLGLKQLQNRMAQVVMAGQSTPSSERGPGNPHGLDRGVGSYSYYNRAESKWRDYSRHLPQRLRLDGACRVSAMTYPLEKCNDLQNTRKGAQEAEKSMREDDFFDEEGIAFYKGQTETIIRGIEGELNGWKQHFIDQNCSSKIPEAISAVRQVMADLAAGRNPSDRKPSAQEVTMCAYDRIIQGQSSGMDFQEAQEHCERKLSGN